MKFLVPNYICLQNPWLRGYCPQVPILSVLCPELNLLNPPPKKIPGYATGWQQRKTAVRIIDILAIVWTRPLANTSWKHCHLSHFLDICYKKHTVILILLGIPWHPCTLWFSFCKISTTAFVIPQFVLLPKLFDICERLKQWTTLLSVSTNLFSNLQVSMISGNRSTFTHEFFNSTYCSNIQNDVYCNTHCQKKKFCWNHSHTKNILELVLC